MNRLAMYAALAAVSLSSCTILKAGSYATDVFMRESDPVLAAAALPTMMKAAEALYLADPKNPAKALTIASLYTMYGNAFLDSEAFLLPDEDFAAKRAMTIRAKRLYDRAIAVLVPIVKARAPGIFDANNGSDAKARAALSGFAVKDVPLLYWTAASILAAFADDPMDFDNAARISGAIALFEKARELAPGWNGGALHELAITIYGSLPADLGGDKEKATAAFEAAKAATKSSSPGAFVSYANSVCVGTGDSEGFKASLKIALELPDRPEAALMDSLARRKAERLLADVSLYF